MHTKTQCNKCGSCCKGSMGPFVFPSDIIKISDTLNVDCTTFINQYCEKNIINFSSERIEIYSIRCDENGCVFLTDERLCKIYSSRPYQCIHAPYKFLSKYEMWSHMKCLDKELLEKCDSSKFDLKIFEELLSQGYKNF